MPLPNKVRIVEVGPRDGLQNEAQFVPTSTKLELIQRLRKSGLRTIEATAFVSPKWVPQMRDHAEVTAGLVQEPGQRYPVLTPNVQGFQAAIAAGAREVAVFASASETFSQKNINCSIASSLERFRPLLRAAGEIAVPVRGYVSCVLGCPYESYVDPQAVVAVARELYGMGCYEISLGDTIGVGNPLTTRVLLEHVTREIPVARLAGHFHDTYGMGITNVFAALESGVSVFDSSVAGLGGCPYAKGASGNVATEDVVWLMQSLGVETDVDLERLVDTSRWISDQIGRQPLSHLGRLEAPAALAAAQIVGDSSSGPGVATEHKAEPGESLIPTAAAKATAGHNAITNPTGANGDSNDKVP